MENEETNKKVEAPAPSPVPAPAVKPVKATKPKASSATKKAAPKRKTTKVVDAADTKKQIGRAHV